jgi:hypothetical protein
LSFKRPVAPFKGLADELEDRFLLARCALDDFIPLVFGRRDVSALGLPFLLVLAGAVFEHGVGRLLGLLERCEGAVACVLTFFTLGGGFEGSIKLGFRKPVVVRVALGPEFLCKSVESFKVSRSEQNSPMPRSDKVEGTEIR